MAREEIDIIRLMKSAFMFLSRSGAGKGTQADFLRNHFGAERTLYISTGDHLRELAEKHDLLAGKYMEEKVMRPGNRAPAFSPIWVWAERMINEFTPQTEAVIFEGSPRTILEARALDEAFEFFEIENVYPLLLDITPEEARKRLLGRKRGDDTEAAIERRLAFYERDVMPILSFYQGESPYRLVRIDGMLPPEEVFEQIKRVAGSTQYANY